MTGSGYDLEAFGRVALAGLLGAVIGIEREVADKPAGLRTHILVAAGCALLVILAQGAVEYFQRYTPDEQIMADPIRVIQAIVIGISFLGTGTIIHYQERHVEGLTTAASIFLTAGIGIAVGIDRTWLAVETAVFALLVLISIGWVEKRVMGRRLAAEQRQLHKE
jgi:putative Mg2+ transporter-C (MgtC) family protein